MKTKRILDRAFFTCSAEELAPKLLGKILCRKDSDGCIIKNRICVTEAYPTDDAVNDAVRAARVGKTTAQTRVGGTIYVKEMRGGCRFDIVAGNVGDGESVLIRGIDPYPEGPLIAADALLVDTSLDGADLLADESSIWLEDDGVKVQWNVPTQRRLGDKAPIDSVEKQLRFTIKEIVMDD